MGLLSTLKYYVYYLKESKVNIMVLMRKDKILKVNATVLKGKDKILCFLFEGVEYKPDGY